MNKKSKIIMSVIIGISGLVLAMIIFIQFKVVYETDITSIDTMREEDLQAELVNWKSKYEEVERRYQEVKETLNKYKEETTTDKEAKKNLEEELENLQLILGLTDVEGEGITITLKDTENATRKIDSDDLMIIVNNLKNAGAEAISINEQRIVNSTDFVYIDSSSFIKVNSQRIVSPYVIKVIGDADYLRGALIGTGGKVDELKDLDIDVNIEEAKKIRIPKYNGEMTTKYMSEES